MRQKVTQETLQNQNSGLRQPADTETYCLRNKAMQTTKNWRFWEKKTIITVVLSGHCEL